MAVPKTHQRHCYIPVRRNKVMVTDTSDSPDFTVVSIRKCPDGDSKVEEDEEEQDEEEQDEEEQGGEEQEGEEQDGEVEELGRGAGGSGAGW